MYLLIWVAFLEIIIALFTPEGYQTSLVLHEVVGVATVLLSYYVFLRVKRTACPQRIKLITRTMAYLAIASGVLGIVLDLPARSIVSIPLQEPIQFVHVALAIAIITQASASATAYDMWEEKEFEQTTTGASR